MSMNYIVKVKLIDKNDIFIVRANSKKEAIDIVWSEYFKKDNKKSIEMGYLPVFKKMLYAEKIDSEKLFIKLH